jgi:hypothetical protein
VPLVPGVCREARGDGVIWLLAVWVGVAATVVLPFRRFILAGSPAVVGWTLAIFLALLWPWAALMLVRKAFVVACIGATGSQPSTTRLMESK